MRFLICSCLLWFCAACAQNAPQRASAANGAPNLSSKVQTSNMQSEVFVGRESSTPLPSNLRFKLKGLLPCVASSLKSPSGFKIQIINEQIATVEGEVQNEAQTLACLKSQNILQLLQGYWIWTANLTAPKEVRKNLLSLRIKTPHIFQGTK